MPEKQMTDAPNTQFTDVCLPGSVGRDAVYLGAEKRARVLNSFSLT